MTKQYFSFVLFIFLSASIIGQSAIYDSSVGADFTEIDSYLNENTANGYNTLKNTTTGNPFSLCIVVLLKTLSMTSLSTI